MWTILKTLLGGLAGAGRPGTEAGMTKLDTLDALDACLAVSEARPVFIFKHSTRCPVSSGALSEVRAWIDGASEPPAPVYINYVVESRPVSNAIADVLGVRHESPQILLVSGGSALWHTSHGAIRPAALTRALAEAGG